MVGNLTGELLTGAHKLSIGCWTGLQTDRNTDQREREREAQTCLPP